jgi:hypothetical protein
LWIVFVCTVTVLYAAVLNEVVAKWPRETSGKVYFPTRGVAKFAISCVPWLVAASDK